MSGQSEYQAVDERPGPLVKVPFSYYGGKVGLAPRIVELLPPHRVYMEPFFGSGAVLFRKPPARFEIVNDIDRNVATFFRVLREDLDQLELLCSLTPHSRTEFVAATLDDEDLTDLERARRFWCRVNQSFAKTAGVQTGWSITTARSTSVPSSILSRIGRFGAAVDRLIGVSIECCDAADLVTRLATDDTVVYADPPYLAETRRGRDRHRPGDYRHDMGLPEDHERLAEVLTTTPAKVILSGYPSPLYEDLYAGWHRIEVPVRVHSSNSVTAERGQRIEVLWLNYEPTARAADNTLFEEVVA
jgi:DNA adenine methylase